MADRYRFESIGQASNPNKIIKETGKYDEANSFAAAARAAQRAAIAEIERVAGLQK